MSRIYFHSRSGTREIYGTERAWMGLMTDDVGLSPIVNRHHVEQYARFVPTDEYPHEIINRNLDDRDRIAECLRNWARYGRSWVVNGEPYDCWELTLNTCMAVGGDAMKLCTRLHAQCEIHSYVEGHNRAWLADMIDQGVIDGLMRSGKHWPDLAEWLRSTNHEPVVTSYSVCRQFPNQEQAGVGDELWGRFDADERWTACMKTLRRDGPELKPEDWRDYRFGHRMNAFWLASMLNRSRISSGSWRSGNGPS